MFRKAFLGLLVVPVVLTALAACFLAFAPGTAAAPGDSPESTSVVWVTRATGIIDPPLASFLMKTMEDAAAAGAAALVVEIDTPGGLDSSMRDIIQAEIDSPIPVVFYVSPQGARAASAGLYILMGADVAAMAPQTNLGAATPVSMGEEMDEVMEAKVTNDAAAYIRGLASTHQRNADWAEQAVREAVSLPAQEAHAKEVVDFVAEDLTALLQAIDGHETVPKGITLQTAGAAVVEVRMGWVQRFLHAIATPDIAYVLMTLGVLGIILELSTPGLGVAGIAGIICLLLAFYSFQILPVSIVGIALVVFAFILFVAEIKIQSSGILGFGGAAALIVGGLLLFDTSAAYLRVSWPVLIVVAVIVLAFFLLVVKAVTRAMRRLPVTGVEGLVGETGVSLSPLVPEGHVRVHGETWKAKSEEGHMLKDQQIEVLRTEDLVLIVRKRDRDRQQAPGRPRRGR